MRTLLTLLLLTTPLHAETIDRLVTPDGLIEIFVVRSAGKLTATVVYGEKAGRVIMGGGQPPVPPPGPPVDSTLTTFVRGLTVKVETTDAEREAVADIFTRGAAEIRARRLDGSAQILKWTDKEMEALPKWKAWLTTLKRHLVNERKVDSQKAWTEAFEEIGKGVAP